MAYRCERPSYSVTRILVVAVSGALVVRLFTRLVHPYRRSLAFQMIWLSVCTAIYGTAWWIVLGNGVGRSVVFAALCGGFMSLAIFTSKRGPLARREAFLAAWGAITGSRVRSLCERRSAFTDATYRRLYRQWRADAPTEPAAAFLARSLPAKN